jgi:GT2 family glycosyltransferase
MRAAPPPFTAVIVLHDSPAELRLLLDSLARHAPAAELIVVDSGSRSDEGAQVAEASGAHVIRLPENPGFGAANNAGVAAATADVTLLLNPDVIVHDDALDTLAAAARGRDALHVPRLLNPDGTVQRSVHPRPGRLRELLPAVVHPRVLPRPLREAADPWRAAGPGPVEAGWAIAACLAARTATLRELGPFDPDAWLFYEDLDLCLSAAATGRPTLLHPSLTVAHTGGHSTGPALGGAYLVQAERRRAVVRERLGRRALLLDDVAQALTFTTRAAARRAVRRDAERELAQLRALRAARGGSPRPGEAPQ